MNHRTLVVLALLFCISAASASWAAEYGIGLRAGTQGLGIEGGAGIREWVTVRGALYGSEVSFDVDEGGIDYDSDLQLGGYGVLADFFPMRGKFRITAGLFSNRNEFEIRATPTENIEIGGRVYSPEEAGTLRGAIDFDSSAPYVGIGWGNVAKGGRVGFLLDLGALHQGSGEVTLDSDSTLVDPDDLAQEIAEIEGDIDGYDFWPVISFGVAIRF